MRKLIGMLILLIFLTGYIGMAVLIGSKLTGEHWLVSLLFYCVAGIGWAIPLKPLMRWMHAKDQELPSTEV